MRAGSAAAAAAALLTVAVAAAPSGAAAEPPGPAALHAERPFSPELAPTGRWRAPPLLVSGATAARNGEFLYTDYLYDDRGPDTSDAPAPAPPRVTETDFLLHPATGDAAYPGDEARHANNAADLLELRVKDTRAGVAFRFVLSTLIVPDSTAIAVGLDTDPVREIRDWGHGLGDLGPLGVDRVLFTDGRTARYGDATVPVRTSVERNQIEVVVPHSRLDPNGRTIRMFAVTGLAGGPGFAPVADPPVLNVAFRLEADNDEPMGRSGPAAQGSRGVTGYGFWREHAQAKALAARDISAFEASVDFGALARGARADTVPDHGITNRLYVSGTDQGEGVTAAFPQLRSRVQPYALYVPENLPKGPARTVLYLHSTTHGHNQYTASNPGVLRDFGDRLEAVIVTPLGRGGAGDLIGPGELDAFEALAEAGRVKRRDKDRTYIGGYSQGGYGMWRLGALHPDVFAAGVATVGRGRDRRNNGTYTCRSDDPARQVDLFLEGLRHLPVMSWWGVADQLSPIPCILTFYERLDGLGYRHEADFMASDHVALSVVDRWQRQADFLSSQRREPNPARVTYRRAPATEDPDLGLVHDHAHWLSGIRLRDPRQGDNGLPSAVVDAASAGFGLAGPAIERATGNGTDPVPYTSRTLTWRARRAPRKNRLTLRGTNLGAVTVDLRGARLRPGRPLELVVDSDGPTTITLKASGRRSRKVTLVKDARVVRPLRRVRRSHAVP